MTVNTIGELKAFIKDYSDDTKIICYKSDMETRGYREGTYISSSKYKKETKDGYDSFDHIDYKYEVFVKDEENGVNCISLG